MENHQMMKQRVKESDQDYISTLPNSILCTILCPLSIREAVKTSVLSSKWKYVWTTPNNLILDADNILKRGQYSATNICHLSETLRFQLKSSRTEAFVANVTSYLSCLRRLQIHPHKVEKLRVCFTFRRGSRGCDDLAQWIGFAIDRNVEEIDLYLLEDDELSAPHDGAFLVFPCEVVGNEGANGFTKSCLKCLRLAHCALAPHNAYNSGFTALTTLDLMKVDLISGEHIQLLLASCHKLEWLSLIECCNVDYLKIDHPSCQHLKYLNVSLCCQLKAIMVKSSSLETLEYRGFMIDFMFNTPKLDTFFSHTIMTGSAAHHSKVWPIFRVGHLPQLETLFLECDSLMSDLQGRVMANRLPTFPNLRQLIVIKVAKFQQDPWLIAAILKGCPTLGKLELHLWTIFNSHDELWRKSLPPRWPHNHLKEAAITGIKGHASEIGIAIYLLQNATALQKMTIDPRRRMYEGNGKWGVSKACDSWSRVGKQKVSEHLKQQAQELSSQVELLIL